MTATTGLPSGMPERQRLELRARRGAGWFFWIAAVSVINSVILITGGGRTFVLGLGITQVVEGVAAALEQGLAGPGPLRFLALGLNVLVAILIGLIGRQARKGSVAIYGFGLVLYTLDGLLLLVFADWIGVVFHAIALAFMTSGFLALRKVSRGQAATLPPS